MRDILEKTVEMSFDVVEPTGKVFMHAVDVSGSMSGDVVQSVGLSCCEIAATMALITAKAEKNYTIRGFATDFRDLGITAKDSFSSAVKKASNQNFGGTDASVAYDWMIKNKFKADIICFWTDSESWAGYKHPSQALAKYREKVNPIQLETLQEKNIGTREALERARALRRARREFGVDGITRYTENVDGEWLEDWSDSNSMPLNPKASESNSNSCA